MHGTLRPMFFGWRVAGLDVFYSTISVAGQGGGCPARPSRCPLLGALVSPSRIIRLTARLVACTRPCYSTARDTYLLTVKQFLGETSGAQVLPVEGRGFAVREGSG